MPAELGLNKGRAVEFHGEGGRGEICGKAVAGHPAEFAAVVLTGWVLADFSGECGEVALICREGGGCRSELELRLFRRVVEGGQENVADLDALGLGNGRVVLVEPFLRFPLSDGDGWGDALFDEFFLLNLSGETGAEGVLGGDALGFHRGFEG